MSITEFAYKPQGATLERYILSRTRRCIIRGPLGSGKTNASCWRLFRHIREQAPEPDGVRRSRWVAVRNTYPDLFGTTVKDWLEMFGDLGDFTRGGLEPPTHRLKFKDEETGDRIDAEVVFLALDRPDHVRKVRGLQITGGWLNEVKELSHAVVDMLDLRTGRYPKEVDATWHGLFGDTNSPDTDHWLYRLAEEEHPEGWEFLTQPGGLIRDGEGKPWRINPTAENVSNLPGRARYYLDGMSGKGQDWIKVNLANEYGFVKEGRAIYPDYVDSQHCRAFELDPRLPLIIGLDFGLTPAATIGQLTPRGQWRVRSEVVMERAGFGNLARELKQHLAERYPVFKVGGVWGDPAGSAGNPGDDEERTGFQLLEAAGVYAKPAPGNNDVSVRVAAVEAALRLFVDGEPGFLIHPDCKVTRKGMQGGYCYRRVLVAGDERYRDKPDKNRFSHPCEAKQYMILGGGGAALVLPPKKPRPKIPVSRSNQ